MATRMFRVGLTGGLASGKSTVLAEFAAVGVPTIDADALARRALDPGSPLIAEVSRLLGAAVVRTDGQLDRQHVASLVFADAGKRRQLEALVHPVVLRAEDDEVARLESLGSELVVVDVPLLYEVHLEHRFARVVVAACSTDLQLQRAVARGMSEADARSRIAAQLPIEEKRARADYIIDTGGSLAETARQARAVIRELMADARAARRGRERHES